ncbi:MAG: protein kinase [Bacteroidia bacterium]|nr:protein kinase [Bacteroidia bacterium]
MNNNLQNYSYQNSTNKTEHTKKNLEAWRQIAVGIRGLHHNGFIHRDINPKNILIAKSGPHLNPVLKITDFGVSHNGQQSLDTLAGTLSHMPPEQLKAGNPGSKMNDLYALRVTFVEMLKGESIWVWKIRDPNVLIFENFRDQGTYPVMVGIPTDVIENCHPSLIRVLNLDYKNANIDDFIKVIDEEIYKLSRE